MKKEANTDMKYDHRHDVLHVFLGNQANASADEEHPGIYVNRDESTEQIVGFTILDFSKQKESLRQFYPEYKF